MIKITELQKTYRTEEVETIALNKLSFEVKKANLFRNGPVRLRQIDAPEHPRPA